MKNMYAPVSGIIFGIVTVAQAVRAFNQWPVQVGSISVPVWFSWVIMVVAGGLCIWAFTSRRQ